MIKNYNKTAILTPAGKVSYSQMFAYIDIFADHTPHTKGTRTIIFSENREGWIYAFFAIWQNKGVAVPVDASLGVSDLAYIIGDCQPEQVWTSARLENVVKKAAIEAHHEVRIMIIDEFRALAPTPIATWQGENNFETMTDECAVIIYTSGTTGNPKGVMLSYRNIMTNVHSVSVEVPIFNESRRTLILLPLHHVLPLVGTVVLPLLTGGGVAICPSMSGPDIMQTLQDGRIGIMIGVPRLWQTLYNGIMKKINASTAARMLYKLCEKAKSKKLSQIVFRSVHEKMGGQLTYCVSGGAALDKEIAVGLRTLGLDVLEGYGMTEAAPLIAFTRPDDIVPGSVGKPLSSTETILAPDGELMIKGPNVMMGYWNKPEETAKAVDGNGYLHTGDLGRFDSKGRIYITGRTKELIILSNGKNVQPAEIEYKVEKFDKYVKEAAVIADGDQLATIIVPVDALLTCHSDEELTEMMKRQVLEPYNLSAQGYKKLKTVFISRQPLPRTKLDKIQRFKLRDLIEPKSEEPGAKQEKKEQTPATMSEEMRILCEYIESEKHMPATPAMHLETDLGFDSLDFVGLQGFIEQTFGVSIKADELPRFRNLQELADKLTATHTRRDVERLDWHTLLHADTAAEALALPCGGLGHLLLTRLFALFFKLYNRLSLSGRENLPKKGPFIMAANHQSFMDGAIIMAGVPWAQIDDCFFYATEEHVQGKVMRHLAHEHNVILMERRNLKNSILKMATALKQGHNIVIFPEGSRTHSGKVGNFKKTFAILAKELHVPIVPARISGAYDAMPRGTHFFKPAPIKVEYLPAVSPDEADSYDSLSQLVKEKIEQQQD